MPVLAKHENMRITVENQNKNFSSIFQDGVKEWEDQVKLSMYWFSRIFCFFFWFFFGINLFIVEHLIMQAHPYDDISARALQ